MRRRYVASGVPGLDRILNGGFLQAGVYIIQGAPGAGKTILANQICFHHVAGGGRAAFVTLLSETHALMLDNLSSLSFFDEEALPERLYYVSALQELEDEGLKGITAMLRGEIKDRKVTLLVLDGLISASETAGSDRELRKFVQEVQAFAAMYGCTVLLLTTSNLQAIQPEHTMVDGLIDLETTPFALRTQSTVHVRKFRGGAVLPGRHTYRITGAGVEIFPRLEATFVGPPSAQEPLEAVATGIEALDRMIEGGGLPAGTCTALVGPPGSAKTVISLQFLDGCSDREPGLFFGFYESPARLLANSRSLGLSLHAHVAGGSLEFSWHPVAENILDELGHGLIEAVQSRGARRLVVDGLAGFFAAATEPERMERFLACLCNELRRLGATALFTVETRDVTGITTSTHFTAVSGIFDNVLYTRAASAQPPSGPTLSIVKLRGRAFDRSTRALRVGSPGVALEDESAQPASARETIDIDIGVAGAPK